MHRHQQIKKALATASAFLVPLTGVEPVRCCHRGILSPLRLPIPPQRRVAKAIEYNIIINSICQGKITVNSPLKMSEFPVYRKVGNRE